MELGEIMRTQHACRYFRPDPIGDDVLYAALEMARFAPNGGNRNAVRFVLVRDPQSRRRLGELYLPLWREVTAAVAAGSGAISSASGHAKSTRLGFTNPAQAMADGDHFAEHFGQHPLIVVVCVDIAETHPTDTDLGRLSIVGGASVYPMAQNLCLALRSQGVATSFTTLLVAAEPQVKELLAIPERFSTACHIVAGYPANPFPTRLRRAEVAEIAFAERFGDPLPAARTEGGRALGSPAPVAWGTRPVPDESVSVRASTSGGAPHPAQPATGGEETRMIEQLGRGSDMVMAATDAAQAR